MCSLRVIFIILFNLFIVRTTCRVGVLKNEAKYYTNDWAALISTHALAEEIANKEGFEITNEVTHIIPYSFTSISILKDDVTIFFLPDKGFPFFRKK